jgi:precorrin-4 methylase
MDQLVVDLLRSIEERLTRIEKRLTEPLTELDPPVAVLSVAKHGSYPDDRQMEQRMRRAAESKVLDNGILRNPTQKRSP